MLHEIISGLFDQLVSLQFLEALGIMRNGSFGALHMRVDVPDGANSRVSVGVVVSQVQPVFYVSFGLLSEDCAYLELRKLLVL